MRTQSYLDDLFKLSNVFDDIFESNNSKKRNFPLLNMRKSENEITISAQVPGVIPEDISIEVVDQNLTISGEKKSSENRGAYVIRERDFGKFSKSVKLPYRVNMDNMRAEIKNGILNISLSKSEDAKPRKIEIQ